MSSSSLRRDRNISTTSLKRDREVFISDAVKTQSTSDETIPRASHNENDCNSKLLGQKLREEPTSIAACPMKKASSEQADGSIHQQPAGSMGCPMKQIDDYSRSSLAPEEAFKSQVSTASKSLYTGLRAQCEDIEANLHMAEVEVLKKDDVAFVLKSNQMELDALKMAHANELKTLKIEQDGVLAARAERKKAKLYSRQTIRSTKRRDKLIQQQEASAAAALRNKDLFNTKRNCFDLQIAHMTEIHQKQLKNLAASQERHLQYEKTLNDLENRHLKEEVRNTVTKKFHVRQSFQIALNKRINDQLREYQLMELRHCKEFFEVEISGFEDHGALTIKHSERFAELDAKQMNEKHAEMEVLLSAHEAQKLALLQQNNVKALKKLVNDNRIILRQLKLKHDQAVASSNKGSALSSKCASRNGSNDSINSVEFSNGKGFAAIQSAVVAKENFEEEEEEDTLNEITTKKSSPALLKLLRRHALESESLREQIKQELNAIRLSQEAKFEELVERHHLEIQKITQDQKEEIAMLKSTQEKEILMEEAMHDTEMKALLERKILNSVLDTVDDGIINISPTGVLLRFNKAAEKIFGYTADEVLGKNIKVLMPKRFADEHDGYLKNYLTTNVKKVIGVTNGRRVEGLRKDGTVFPLQLSVSELKTDENHMFTGIARDLTEEVALEEANKLKDDQKRNELQNLISELDVSKAKSEDLLSQMLPPTISKRLMEGIPVEPQKFESATVFFLDIVGFTTICSKIDPLDTVALLNGIYNMFDSVIQQYDAYKVETIGDSYMVVSGVPKKNNNRHAAEIGTMALHILSVVDQFTFDLYPDIKIQVRIGINSGPVVAGVVGTKMPRYCLFGDTVNSASRMESTSIPGRIQFSENTNRLLREAGGFDIFQRGEIDVKGKGKMMTYFLKGKDGFNLPLPSWKD